jgi:hypothetical protein
MSILGSFFCTGADTFERGFFCVSSLGMLGCVEMDVAPPLDSFGE